MKLNLTLLALSLGLSLSAAAQMVDIGPDATTYRRFLLYPHLEKGFDAISRGDPARALSEFEQAWALAPDNPMVAIYLANAYRHFGKPQRAEAVLLEQLTRNPSNVSLWKALGELLNKTSASTRFSVVPAFFTGRVLSLKTRAQPVHQADELHEAHQLAGSHVSAFQAVAASPGEVAGPAAGASRRGAVVAPAQQRRPGASAPRNRPPAANRAYVFADRAYKASARGAHAEAAQDARQAVLLAPENRAYRSLLVYELMALDQLEEADAVASQAPQHSSAPAAEDELSTRQKLVRQHLAFKSFDAARQALAAGNADAAAESARQGIRHAPGVLAHRVQYIGALLAARKWPEAEQSAGEAIRDVGAQPALLVQRAYALQQSGQRPAAASDLDAALANPALTAQDQQNFRLIAADAALAAGEPQKALELLAPLSDAPGAEAGLANRRALALAASRRSGSPPGATAPAWFAPVLVCTGDALSPACELRPGESPPDPAFPAADAAYKAYNARDYELAASKAREALAISPDNLLYRRLLVNSMMAAGQLEAAEQVATGFLSSSPGDGEMLALRSHQRELLGQHALATADAENALRSDNLSVASQISMLQQLDRRAQARERFATALKEGEFDGQADVDTAYLAVRVGDDAAAVSAFDRASNARALPDAALQDAAYAAGRLGHNAASVDYFKRAIDASADGRLPLAPQQLFQARRAVADRTREGGVYGSLTYRGLPTSGLSLTPGATSDTLQSGLEAYWRPFGYGDGRLVEVYGGLAATLYSKSGLATGASSVQGAVGARVKPLANANLVLALERRLAIGSQAQTDWLARIGYSWDKGLDLRVDTSQWWAGQVYAETGRFFKLKQNYATFEGQAGRNFRLDAVHPRLVIFPHLVLGADRNTGYEKGKEKAVGAGVGTSLRYWFNEDKYAAPRSYWDLSLQYRGRISGDERAKGTFVRFTLSY